MTKQKQKKKQKERAKEVKGGMRLQDGLFEIFQYVLKNILEEIVFGNHITGVVG